MKYPTTKEIIPLIMLCILSGCGKTEISEVPTDGEAIAFFNGQEWKMPARAGGSTARADTFGIGFGDLSKSYGQGLGFHEIIKKKGKQFIFPSIPGNNEIVPVLSYTTNGYYPENTCDAYRMLETDSMDNWIEITEESNNYNEIWGNFSVTLIRTTTCSESKYPDTIRLHKGSFHIWKVKNI